MSNNTKAKRQALKDIKEDCIKEGTSFLAFRKDLNKIMKEITEDYLKLQKQKDKTQKQ